MQPQANLNLNPDAQPRVPTGEQARNPERHLEHAQNMHPEQQTVSGAEQGSKQPTGMPAQSAVAPQVAIPTNPKGNVVTTTAAQVIPAATDDGKLEKPWVDRADEIIEKTAQDPYAEEEAHEELSALYLKQRFNLDIKRNTPQH